MPSTDPQARTPNYVKLRSTTSTGSNSPDNRWLLDAMQHQIPIIYFLGTSPGRYQPIIPTFIVGWHPEHLRVQLAFAAIVGASAQAAPPDAPERRYALREIKARLHQASFRDAVLAAYGGRCAISHLPEPRLLDAAHIIMDSDEQLGHPIVSNGLPLTKLHHAAFDSHLIGSTPISVSMSLTGCWKFMTARFSKSA